MKILVADDHPLVLMGIRRALEDAPEFVVVGATTSGTEVLPLVGRLSPDVVLLDLRMPGLDGLGCLERIRRRHPWIKVVMLSVLAEPEQVEAAFRLGACGYVMKGIDPAQLAPAIRDMVEGSAVGVVVMPVHGEQAERRLAGLTPRELTIMQAVARGRSNQEIGRELWITEQTVKFHLTNIYKKLGVANRTGAARWAYARGFADDEGEPAPVAAGER